MSPMHDAGAGCEMGWDRVGFFIFFAMQLCWED